MNTGDFNDPLWKLLGKAKAVEVSPFFARNVLREVRLARTQSPPAPALLSLLARRWRLALAGCAVACVVAATSSVLFPAHNNTLVLRSGDAEVINNLDELLAYKDAEIWLHRPVY